MKNIGAVSLKLLMSSSVAGEFFFMGTFQCPPDSNFVLFPKIIYYSNFHIRKCITILCYPFFEILQTFNFLEHSVINDIRSDKLLCILYFSLIEYFLNKPPSN